MEIMKTTGELHYLPPRYMNVSIAAQQIIEALGVNGGSTKSKGRRISASKGSIQPGTMAVGIARVGSDSMKIFVGTLEEFARGQYDIGPPMHALVVPASKLHSVEEEALSQFHNIGKDSHSLKR
eukprot:CAMPEP_0167767512 /NCGR_PEP_ID=MMETSP0110_2-20121227/16099_1 /TAXON_ID=629695 /ORGANISM="Gymnochlora sp., Strain CCMP2014" /LENGTH=123 /DNA_ID=CAMNT_0007655975 /DNA_START=491 /DNA_END=862 /DNA_ORIENTATION=-